MENAPVPPKLLILSPQADEARSILAGLRQVGLEALGDHCPRPEELAARVAATIPDLLLCLTRPPHLELTSALTRYQELTQDLPLIILTAGDADPDQLLQARRSGARDVCDRGNFPWMALLIAREFHDLQQRRLVRELRQRVQALEETCGKAGAQATSGQRGANPSALAGAGDGAGSGAGAGFGSGSGASPGTFQAREREDARQFALRINRALGGDYFQLFYQPIISLKGDGEERYNVFIRLRNDRQGVREAKEFLAAAVQSGRMVAVDHWVIEHALLALAEQRHNGRQLNFFINLAEETLREPGFITWLTSLIDRQQVSGNWLAFQVLEEQVRANPTLYTQFAQDLARLGCHLALNRFGIAPHPDRLLTGLAADYVKLDAQLTAGIADDERKEQQLTQLVGLIRTQGKASIATNIEDARTLSVLWTVGVDFVQGNFLQRPAPTLESIQ